MIDSVLKKFLGKLHYILNDPHTCELYILKFMLIFDRPKSVSLICPVLVINMLSGFKSLKEKKSNVKINFPALVTNCASS